MKIKNSKVDRVTRSEAKISQHINILSHYDDETLLDKGGKLIKIIKLSGLDFVTKDEQFLDTYKNRRNNLLKGFSSEFAFYFWEVRRKVDRYPSGGFPDGFSQYVNDAYLENMKRMEMYKNELYIAIIAKQPEGLINAGFGIASHFIHNLDKASKQQYLLKRHKELCEATRKITSTLSEYGCEVLSVYEKNGVSLSASLEFLSQLINFDQHPIPMQLVDASCLLPRKRLFFNRKSGAIEMRDTNGKKKFIAMLSIKGYSPVTYQGIFDELSTLRCEYVITQSFRFYDKQLAKNKLRDQQKDLLQSKDESITQTDQIDDAFDDTASGEVGYGKHHYTLACYADTQEELNKQIGLIVSRFSDVDITCVREDIASECAFWAQLPGNFGYITRIADISTKNVAAFASLHNYRVGKLTNNHWGDAVTVFETISGSPYYFNFHYKDVGNFLVFGAMGSGKTVLVGFLILQSMKFGGKRIIFDKDRGLEIMVRAMGGVYESLKPGIATGFNPCQLEDTPENRKFLSFLFKKMLSCRNEALSEQESAVIESAINGMYRLDKASRQFCHIASFFGVKKSDSLRNRFDQWHSEGANAWLFDNAEDNLSLKASILGFDLGHILDDEECKTPALMYLIFRVEKDLEGKRGILFCDEGWKALSDDYFSAILNDWSRTPRKKDNIFGLATQVANDTVSCSINKAINESAFCKIFFPNPSADRKVYIDDLGLSEHEYTLIKTLPDDQHYFLLNYGRSTNKQSVIIRVNLKKLDEVIAIISARESTLALLDQIRAEVGDDPDIWLPIFKQRIKVRANS